MEGLEGIPVMIDNHYPFHPHYIHSGSKIKFQIKIPHLGVQTVIFHTTKNSFVNFKFRRLAAMPLTLDLTVSCRWRRVRATNRRVHYG